VRVAALLVLGYAVAANAATQASGRNWRLSIDDIHCEGSGSLLVVGARIHYLGPKGPVEAPANQLVGRDGRTYPPKSLVWRGGEPKLAQWLPSGGLANVQSELVADVQIKFDVGETAAELQLEFGDIPAFPLTRKGASRACAGLLKPAELQAPRRARPGRVETPGFRVYRGAYPCSAARSIEADHPPHLPRQLLLFGHGFLPSARHVDLPMGKAPAQPYAYSGPDNLKAIEDAARRAVAADFPGDAARLVERKAFAFNWGVQKARSGNDVYSIGIYDLGPCP
jgi:hypothetical protein